MSTNEHHAIGRCWRGGASHNTVRLIHRKVRIRNPELDPLENVFNRPIRSRESMTPTLVSRKHFTVVVHHRTEADGTGRFQNEAIIAIDKA
jgi:hypothetical protein